MASSRRSAPDADTAAGAAIRSALSGALADLASAPASAGEAPAAAPLLVAFSGGLDSTVLLHALAACVPASRLHAAHVHHGLQRAADDWPEHCRRQAQSLGVGFSSLRLPGPPAPGESLEAWARQGRYDALEAEAVRLGCAVIMTAHHADDQAETLLFRLARGAGLQGLGAMAASRAQGRVRLLRPLLALPRAALQAFARQQDLQWVDDPTNTQLDRTRNHLRARVLPALEQALPGARANLVKAAALAREAHAVLTEVARGDLEAARARAAALAPTQPRAIALAAEGGVLHRQPLLALSPARRRLALRQWLSDLGLPTPSQSVLAEMLKQLLEAQGAAGEVAHAGAVLRRYRDWLWADRAVAPAALAPEPERLRWRGERTLAAAGGRVVFEPGPGGIEAAALAGACIRVGPLGAATRVRLRAGGPSRSLKNWHQQHGVPAHLRPSLPGVFVDERLVFVAGLGVNHEGVNEADPGVADPGVADPRVTTPPGTERLCLRWEPTDPDDPRAPLCRLQAWP